MNIMNNGSTGSFTEKELMNDLLASEKQVISAYSTGITESSCQNLRNTLMDNYKNVQDIQYKVFDAMKQKGWYQTKDAPTEDVNQAKSSANQMANELR
ncbi:spore coat protein [Alkalithermobacter paradoxus]|uniref:Coat F domain protein n=1 Tax=Alkalithermobacter paradoxus TaxID=29349 RepID=A0A1V4IBC6_9FIRM|nr:coat F domain protein [[Clostridium] thermoalcaliphilum]